MFRRRGYRLVTLAEAMADSAYRSPETYVGAKGLSWLQRWQISRGDPIEEQPRVPDWVQAAMK
jgi:hypothetical protein